MKGESIIQAGIVEALSYIAVRHNFFFFSIPNERRGVSFAELMSLKKMGMVPGIPDLCVIKNKKVYFMEVKTETGKLSLSQSLVQDEIIKHAAGYSVVRSIEDAMMFLRACGVISA